MMSCMFWPAFYHQSTVSDSARSNFRWYTYIVSQLIRPLMLQVSSFFYDFVCDKFVWRSLYRTTRLPRPPGPNIRQSAEFLEDALVTSVKVDRWCPPSSQPRVTTRLLRSFTHDEKQFGLSLEN
ncbi:hypothetical protein BV22DRAFT_1034452, partial [Leucogyrophana mollusca]